jgi:acetyltransferase
MLFGHGGTAAEQIDDKAVGLPPLNLALAREMMARTRVHRLLQGVRGAPAANLDGIAVSLLRLAQLVADLPEVKEVDVNPVLADRYGIIAVDARMRVEHEARPGDSRLAIRPYPKELEEPVRLADGRELLLRPIVPEDEPAMQRGFAQLSPEEIRFRFHVPTAVLDHVTAARFTQIDYDREMALVLTDPGIPGTTDGYGVVRLTADPDNERAEFAIIVRREYTGLGLGLLMMHRIMDYARRRGIGEIYGDVLRDNHTMLRLCERLGFHRQAVPDEPNLVRVVKPIRSR